GGVRVPILVGSAAPPPPPPPSETIGTFEVEWVAPDGSVWPLCDRRLPWWTLAQWSHVVGAAPVRIAADEHPRGGTRVRHVQPQPRIMVWPLRVAGRTHMQFVTAVRQLARAVTQTRRLGPGRIVIRRPDGTARESEAGYDGGIDGGPHPTPRRGRTGIPRRGTPVVSPARPPRRCRATLSGSPCAARTRTGVTSSRPCSPTRTPTR